MKESRLVEVMKRQKKKKAKELHASPTTSSFSENSNTSNLEGEVLRLRDREQALMDAVCAAWIPVVALSIHFTV